MNKALLLLILLGGCASQLPPVVAGVPRDFAVQTEYERQLWFCRVAVGRC